MKHFLPCRAAFKMFDWSVTYVINLNFSLLMLIIYIITESITVLGKTFGDVFTF